MLSFISRDFHVRAEPKWYSRSIDLFFYEKMSNGNVAFVENLTMRTVESGTEIPDSAIAIPLDAAQELMDSLWQCGLRPSEGAGSAGALLATQNHLKDMQEISKKLLDMINKTTTQPKG